ncbi:MAG: class I SAM-dependent RNA methyltransferase [Cyclobacteriaceae bacterium]|nr:class I SAM-dependent RNA methyltransferase [Cyclobacteriaceae bacterium]
MRSTSKIVITCPPKINVHLAKEVEQLGFKIHKVDRMGVQIIGSFNDTMKLNLHLRTGYRVLYQIHSFKAVHPDDLYKAVKKFPWEEYIKPDGYVSIQSYVKNDFIRDTKFANLRFKDGIADRYMAKFDKRPNSGSDTSQTVIFLHWQLDNCNIYIDTSGETIAKHGYRKIPFKAPMLEALAAATILASEWDKKSNFINPMCGSGTLAIEAALMAIEKPPGLMRENFGFMHIIGYNYMYWDKIVKEAKEKVIETDILPYKIIASDLSPEALSAARTNARNAGVEHLITFKKGDFRETIVPEGNGVVFLNPEYGERLGDEKELESIYNYIGDFFKKRCSGYMGYVFTGNLNLAKKIGLRAKRRIEFFNGKIDARLLEYELYAGTKRG